MIKTHWMDATIETLKDQLDPSHPAVDAQSISVALALGTWEGSSLKNPETPLDSLGH